MFLLDPDNESVKKNNMTEFDKYVFVPSFKQFAQFVVDSGDDFEKSKYPGVNHWLPYYMSCNPCHPGKIQNILFIFTSNKQYLI